MENIAVEIFEVGGQNRLADLTKVAVSGSWENALDAAPGTSTATVTLQEGLSFDDWPILKLIHPYYHELRISLDGHIVFEGPIRYYSGPVYKGAQIVADDISAWFGLRFIHDVFDWSTGERLDVIIPALVSSALVGGPMWASEPTGADLPFQGIPDVNIVPWLNVENIPDTLQQQNGTVPAGLGQGDLAVHEPFEELWDVYLRPIVGSRVHMSCQGRQINFWPYGTGLNVLPPASMSDFTSFPNLTRNGDEFVTFVAVKAKITSLSLTTDQADGVTTLGLGSGPWREAGFYEGQAIQSGTGLQIPIGTLIGKRHGFYPLSSVDLAFDMEPDGFGGFKYPAATLSGITSGTGVSGRVTGQGGGVHPDWPVLVERAVSKENLIWKSSADAAAAAAVKLLAPFDTLDESEFKQDVGRSRPWDFVTIVPGQSLLLITPLGGVQLQISHVGGGWTGDGKLSLHVGMQTLKPAQVDTVEDRMTYAQFTSNDLFNNGGTLISVGVNLNQQQRRRRRRRVIGAVAGPYYHITAASRPDAYFWPDSSLFVKIESPTELTKFQALFPSPTATHDIGSTQYDVISLSCEVGST